jgi:hypothetical protein
MKTKTYTSLSNTPHQNAFVVPEGYFEELPAAVLSKCSDSRVKKQSLMVPKPVWWSAAACVTLLLGIWFVVPNITSPLDSSLSKNEDIYAVDDWSDYLSYHICPTIIEDELYASNSDLRLFAEEITDDEISAFGDDVLEYIDYTNIFDYY